MRTDCSSVWVMAMADRFDKTFVLEDRLEQAELTCVARGNGSLKNWFDKSKSDMLTRA